MKRIARTDPVHRIPLLALKSDQKECEPILPLVSDDPEAFKHSPFYSMLTPHDDPSEMASSLMGPGPWTFHYELPLPNSCGQIHFTNKNKRSNITIAHNLKVIFRVERGDGEFSHPKTGKPKLFDIVVHTPVHILSVSHFQSHLETRWLILAIFLPVSLQPWMDISSSIHRITSGWSCHRAPNLPMWVQTQRTLKKPGRPVCQSRDIHWCEARQGRLSTVYGLCFDSRECLSQSLGISLFKAVGFLVQQELAVWKTCLGSREWKRRGAAGIWCCIENHSCITMMDLALCLFFDQDPLYPVVGGRVDLAIISWYAAVFFTPTLQQRIRFANLQYMYAIITSGIERFISMIRSAVL